MKEFDYSFLKMNKISNEVLASFISIEKIQGLEFINRQMYPNVFDKLQNISNIKSINASNAIDGISISNIRFNQLINSKVDSIDKSEHEIIGYRDILDEIHNNYDNYQFREYDLLNFHDKLFSQTGLHHSGSYKREDNMVVETLVDGTKREIFDPVSSSETRKAMDQLFTAYKEADSDPSIPKLLLIPCVVLDFLCIHPFVEGNGRISRLLSLFLLYKNNKCLIKIIILIFPTYYIY